MERSTHTYSWETHPVLKAFVTVATGLCLGVSGSSSLSMVPGGARIVSNLLPFVLLTEWIPGMGYRHVVTQSYLVNDPPFSLQVEWRHEPNVCCGGVRESEEDSCSRRQLFPERALGPLRHACQSAQCWLVLLRAGPSWPPERTASQLLPPRATAAASLGTIPSTLFLNQNVSCHAATATFWQRPPWPDSHPQGAMA